MARPATPSQPLHRIPVLPVLPVFPPKAKINRAAIIDEYGNISAKLEAMGQLEKRRDQLRRVILSWYADADPEEAINEDGKKYSVTISPQALERRITDMEWVMNRLGKERFLQLVTLPLTKLDRYIALCDQDQFTNSARVGPRTVKPVSKYQVSQ